MSNRNLYLAATISCLTAALFGYSVGFIGGCIVLPSFLSTFHLSDLPARELASARSYCVSAWILGCLVGVPAAMPICSRLGRKACLRLTAVLYVVGAGMQIWSSGSLGVFAAGRLINGMGVGAGTLVSPLYIAEISPASERNMLMSAYQVLVQLGALVGFWIAFVAQVSLSDSSAMQWQLPVSLQLGVGLILLLGTLTVPESPQYLARKSQHDASLASLAWLRRKSRSDPSLIEESLALTSSLSRRAKLPQVSFWQELRKRDIRYRLMVGIGIMVAQNMVGLNALNYFAPIILQTAGFTSASSSLFLTGVFGLVKLGSALTYMLVCVRVRGNRFWLLLGSAVCAISMFVLACCISSTNPSSPSTPSSITATGVASVLSVYTFAFSFGISLGPISWNICAEIFPFHLNAVCCAITVCTQWLFQLVIAAITPPLIASVGWLTYLIYGGFCVITLAWVAGCVPETRGVAVGREMDELFGAEGKDVGDGEEDEEEVVEVGVDERTGLLGVGRERRLSYASI